MKEAEEYSIRMAEKTQEDISSQEELKSRHIIRRDFWSALLNEINKNSTLFQNISPSIYNWIGAGSGMRGVGYNFSISKKYVRVELYIDRGDHSENKFIFDKLYANRESIEKNFGKKLEWERLEDKRASRIKYEKTDCNVFEKDQWEEQIEFLSKGMIQFERVFKDYLKKLNREIKM